jgi:hypothetical protein
MADLYKIEILSLEETQLRVKVDLINVQAGDLPANKNVALQFATDAYYHMKNFDVDINQNKEEVDELLKNAATQKLDYFNSFLHEHKSMNYAKFISIAEEEILVIKEIAEANWEVQKIKLWEDLHYAGDKVAAEKNCPSQTFYIRFRDPELLKHLKVGLIWSTPMFDREELA